MNYEVIFTAKADSETMGLPPRAFKLLFEALGQIARDPWAATFPDGPSTTPYRWAPFGDDGMLVAYIDEDNGSVRIYGLTWTG
ncbi:hypothetical protein [Nocardiopsis rhodophaea]|uniref:type II toxin-antitoxin system RelE family toxin n=1 Tax=Nocardiopsis rhodophaea TaxID=280238 RepID=UPI0031D4F316